MSVADGATFSDDETRRAIAVADARSAGGSSKFSWEFILKAFRK
tara:strand:- start:109 stop:240 length:132 start_codon:yes stop_codon:yes gene_type:complete